MDKIIAAINNISVVQWCLIGLFGGLYLEKIVVYFFIILLWNELFY